MQIVKIPEFKMWNDKLQIVNLKKAYLHFRKGIEMIKTCRIDIEYDIYIIILISKVNRNMLYKRKVSRTFILDAWTKRKVHRTFPSHAQATKNGAKVLRPSLRMHISNLCSSQLLLCT